MSEKIGRLEPSEEQYVKFIRNIDMTPEEKHQYNKRHAISPISYKAVCKTDFTVALREWIEQWLEVAYEAGFNNAKKGEL